MARTKGVGFRGKSKVNKVVIAPTVWTSPTEQDELTASDIKSGDFFGQSVDISSDGNTMIAGSPGEDGGVGDPIGNAGAAYIFTRSGTVWSEQDILLASDAQGLDNFGFSVSISADGDTALIGAVLEDGGAGDPTAGGGAAYVFTRTEGVWTEQDILRASDTQAGDDFGRAVAISSNGDTAVVGARSEDGGDGDPLANAGQAYVFTRSGAVWSEQDILAASDPQANDRFGFSVSISGDGDTVIVGANDEDGGAGDPKNLAGQAYVFTRSGSVWTEQAILTASDAQALDRFGTSVSLSTGGNTVIVGAFAEDGGVDDPEVAVGAAYIFTLKGGVWTERAILRSDDGLTSDLFGVSVSMSGDGGVVIVGAFGNGAGNTGAAYVFAKTGTVWFQQSKLTAPGGASGDKFGEWVSISTDGTTAVVAAPSDQSLSGTSFVFITN